MRFMLGAPSSKRRAEARGVIRPVHHATRRMTLRSSALGSLPVRVAANYRQYLARNKTRHLR
jgi:hypothetical protein